MVGGGPVTDYALGPMELDIFFRVGQLMQVLHINFLYAIKYNLVPTKVVVDI